MSQKAAERREKRDEWIRKSENMMKILQMSKAMQRRFQLIPKSYLNNVTVAGIRDTSLGRVKNGTPVGGNVVRVNNPSPGTKSDFHRICIDAKGVSNKNNPHIPVSAGTVKTLEYTQKTLQITGKVLFVISIFASGARVAKSVYDEIKIDDEIKSLEEMVDSLKEDLEEEESPSKRRSIEEALEHCQELLTKARYYKKNGGAKTLLTTFCVAGEYLGAAAGGFGGATAGAAIGAAAGPVGAVVGAVVGGFVGSVVGNEAGSSIVNNAEFNNKRVGTAADANLFSFGKDVRGEVGGLHANTYIGEKGVDIGVCTSLFDMHEKDKGLLSVLKVGSNVALNSDGVDIGVEGKVVRAEAESSNFVVGTGLSLDTGVKFTKDEQKMEFLGFGFSSNKKGVSFKLPIFDITFKH